MFIAIEGADASGKSSLIAAIESEIRRRYPHEEVRLFHKGRPQEETQKWALDEYASTLEHLSWVSGLHGIADRWHWGEVTYAPLKRPHTCSDGFGLLKRCGWRWVELFMASRGMSQFWLYQPLDVITKRLGDRGDDFVAASELEKILVLYGVAANDTHTLAGKLTPDPDSLDEIPKIATRVVEKAEKVAASVAHLVPYPEYIGGPRPSVLLVGDNRNDPTQTILPFKPTGSNSGDYLLSALPESLWRSVGIINAADVNGLRAHGLVKALGNPYIIALGRNAENELRRSGFYETQYTVVPHPQYVRRFHHHDKHEYGLAIESLSATRGKEPSQWILP